MILQKTSMQLDPAVCKLLRIMYPELTISEIVRFALSFVVAEAPVLVNDKPRLMRLERPE